MKYLEHTKQRLYREKIPLPIKLSVYNVQLVYMRRMEPTASGTRCIATSRRVNYSSPRKFSGKISGIWNIGCALEINCQRHVCATALCVARDRDSRINRKTEAISWRNLTRAAILVLLRSGHRLFFPSPGGTPPLFLPFPPPPPPPSRSSTVSSFPEASRFSCAPSRRANFGNRAANLRRYAYRVLLHFAAGDSRISARGRDNENIRETIVIIRA